MTRHQRRRWTRSALRVIVLTGLAVTFQYCGTFLSLEHVLYDKRVRLCQHYMPRPTDRLVHLDIDDTALNQVGRWPWHRDVLAEILEEIRLADPQILAMDVILPDAEDRYEHDGKMVAGDPILAAEIKRFGRVLVPSSLSFAPVAPLSPIERRVSELLTEDLERTAERCSQVLTAEHFDPADLEGQVNRAFLTVRPDVMFERTDREVAASTPPDKVKIKRRLLPHADPRLPGPLDRLFDEAYERALREQTYARFSLPLTDSLQPALQATAQTTPILPIAQAAMYGSLVDYLPDDVEGTVRSVPLFAVYRGRLLPQMGLVVACATLGVDIHSVRIEKNAVIIPRPGRDIVIPTSTRENTVHGSVGMLMEVPFFGKRGNWMTMYDYPRHEKTAQHVSLYEVWRICQTRRRMAANESAIDQVLRPALAALGSDDDAIKESLRAQGAAKSELVRTTLDSIHAIIAGSADDKDPDTQKYVATLRKASAELEIIGLSYLVQSDPLRRQLDTLRSDLHGKLHGKSLFLGTIASGHVDQVPTALFSICPGVVVHGAVFNAILTGELWRVEKPGVSLLLTLIFGLLAGFFAATLPPARGSAAALLMAAGYLAVNGYVLFDRYNIIVSAAGPLVAIAIVWSGVTVFDFVTEISDRRRITKRFRNYVDPSLVNWVIEHPEQEHFRGESREMTMGFTDLAGFTTLTESLGEKTVPLLAEYMGEMIPAIRANRGYVSRLMGDGIYFFFGAPEPADTHATQAVKTALTMHEALARLNERLPQRGLPQLNMRCGLSTGRVIIGDAGSSDFSDYTALGDRVNLGARLETANKIFGTRILASERTIELLRDSFLVRPIAYLVVAGKRQGVVVYEPLCPAESATPEQKKKAACTAEVYDAFRRADFAGCIAACDRMDGTLPKSKFTELYRELSRKYLATPPQDFDGQIVLTEK